VRLRAAARAAEERLTAESPILRVTARFAVPFSLLVAGRIFLQGHDLPGGGFIAGVLVAAAGAMYLLAWGTRRAARIAWWRVSMAGLLIALVTGTVPLVRGAAFMDHVILHVGSFHLPTATFFDLGVMLIVIGTLMTIFVELAMERR
jgi:multisubunit Na+/H+ antiporter MnhB subunit